MRRVWGQRESRLQSCGMPGVERIQRQGVKGLQRAPLLLLLLLQLLLLPPALLPDAWEACLSA